MANNKLTEDSVVVRNQDILFSKLDGEFLAIDSQAGYVYSMNETASRIWDIIVEPCVISYIASRLCVEFSVKNSVCVNETLSLLQNLSDAGLIKVHNA